MVTPERTHTLLGPIRAEPTRTGPDRPPPSAVRRGLNCDVASQPGAVSTGASTFVHRCQGLLKQLTGFSYGAKQ